MEKSPEALASNEPDKIETIIEIDVPPGQEGGVRLDVYLTGKLANATRAKVQRGIKEGGVDVNGRTRTRPSWGVQPGDHIVCRVMKPPPIVVAPEAIPLDVVYEDDDLIVVNKPAGMVVHPAFGHRSGTLINALLHHVGAGPLAAEDLDDESDDDVGLAMDDVGPRFEGDLTIRPGLVHRLDKDTTGLMVVAKSDVVAGALGKQFAERTIDREYVALLWGVPDPPEGRVETWLGRDPRNRKLIAVRPEGDGKWAATNYWLEEDLGYLSLVRFKLETGRTHQIRVHAAHGPPHLRRHDLRRRHDPLRPLRRITEGVLPQPVRHAPAPGAPRAHARVHASNHRRGRVLRGAHPARDGVGDRPHPRGGVPLAGGQWEGGSGEDGEYARRQRRHYSPFASAT